MKAKGRNQICRLAGASLTTPGLQHILIATEQTRYDDDKGSTSEGPPPWPSGPTHNAPTVCLDPYIHEL